MAIFRYVPEIFERFPDLRAGVILAEGLRNGPAEPDLKAACADEQKALTSRLGSTPLSEVPSLAAWRAAFRAFGANPTKYRSAPEALLRRLTKKGDIPAINALVDSCNLVSIRYALPVAAMDRRAIHGALAVQFARGDETFAPLGEEPPAGADPLKGWENPDPGEVIFADERGEVAARRWCWRQSAASAAGPETRAATIVIEAQHPGAEADVASALSDLLALLERYTGGEFVSGLLGPGRRELRA